MLFYGVHRASITCPILSGPGISPDKCVICCADCKAPWGKSVICYTGQNKYNLAWLATKNYSELFIKDFHSDIHVRKLQLIQRGLLKKQTHNTRRDTRVLNDLSMTDKLIVARSDNSMNFTSGWGPVYLCVCGGLRLHVQRAFSCTCVCVLIGLKLWSEAVSHARGGVCVCVGWGGWVKRVMGKWGGGETREKAKSEREEEES